LILRGDAVQVREQTKNGFKIRDVTLAFWALKGSGNEVQIWAQAKPRVNQEPSIALINRRYIEFDVGFLALERQTDPIAKDCFVNSLQIAASDETSGRSRGASVMLVSAVVWVSQAC
jgi:hypothetical protein